MDLWEKVAECTRAIQETTDPKMREMLTHLRALWSGLAHDSQTPGVGATAKQIAAVAEIQAELVRTRWVSLTELDDVRSYPNLPAA
jgi:hypothetical protein